MHVLALATSPRRGGNTDTLLEQVIAGARAEGADVEHVIVPQYRIAPCIECNGCWAEGFCVVQDDFQQFYPKLERAERIVLASPMFFGHMTAQAKNLIDRCQCFYARKYVVKRAMPPLSAARKGFLVSAAGHPRIKFDCMGLTMRVWMDALDGIFGGALAFNQLEEARDAAASPEMLQQAFDFGKRIVRD
jgi:putative NADPH-quinone reductase